MLIRTDGGIVCHESTPVRRRRSATNQRRHALRASLLPIASENGDDVFYAVTEEGGVLTGSPAMTIVRAPRARRGHLPRHWHCSITTASYDERYETIDLYPHGRSRGVVPGRDRILDEPVITLAGGGQPCLNRRRVRPACSTSTASRGLAEMRHLQYVTVEEAAYDAAAVRVRDNGTASNPLR